MSPPIIFFANYNSASIGSEMISVVVLQLPTSVKFIKESFEFIRRENHGSFKTLSIEGPFDWFARLLLDLEGLGLIPATDNNNSFDPDNLRNRGRTSPFFGPKPN